MEAPKKRKEAAGRIPAAIYIRVSLDQQEASSLDDESGPDMVALYEETDVAPDDGEELS